MPAAVADSATGDVGMPASTTAELTALICACAWICSQSETCSIVPVTEHTDSEVHSQWGHSYLAACTAWSSSPPKLASDAT
eukprot:4765906-Pyramimonas_sp.AAC.1